MINTKMVKNGPIYTKKVTFEELPPEGKKAYRADELRSQRITVGANTFDADEKAMDRIDRIITVANWKFNNAISMGLPSDVAYAAVYTTELPWKDADNNMVNVTVETLCQVQEASLEGMKNLWVKYG